MFHTQLQVNADAMLRFIKCKETPKKNQTKNTKFSFLLHVQHHVE